MKKLLSTLFLIAGVTLIPYTSYAQEQQGCFMLDENGQQIDLSALCGGSTGSSSTSGRIKIPIQGRANGIPIIFVTFNGSNSRKTFPMMFDTGASTTALTPKVAKILGVKTERFISVQTAGGTIEAPIGRIASAKAGDIVVKNMEVIIPPSLEIGLLGQNFYANYDVNIKENEIEFRQRR
ncbi:MAG: aspartyl protease [Moorea sp. SIO2B7]|nr:aspartyl protease [Moorena sp. SIO2B7]